MSFSSIFSSVINYFTTGKQDTDLKASLDVFKTFLNDEENTTIRLWVSGAPGYAHQTSTINLLYQLTNNDDDTDHGFGYAGTIEVYYQQDAGNTILTILQNLLPSLEGKTEGTVNQATVKLIQWKDGDKAPDTEVNLGFTGAEEQVKKTISTSPQLAIRLNTKYFLRLEPYLWTQPEEIQFLDTSQFTIDLAKQDLLQKGAFKQRPYWQVLPVAEPDWNYYSLNGYANEVAVLQSILEQTGYDLGITYSITTDDGYVLQSPPEDRMFEAITGYLASQMDGSNVRTGAKPIILLSMDDFSNRTGGVQTTISQLIKGAQTGQEKNWSVDVAAGGNGITPYTQKRLNELRQLLKPSGYRSQYLTGVKAPDRVDYVWDATEENVQGKYGWLNTAKNLVLFIQIGNVPAPIFNYMMSKASMPAIFAGSDTANLALQLGTPYFNVSRPSTSKPQYPTMLLGYTTFDKYPLTYLPMVYVPKVVYNMQQIANNINFKLEKWPSTADKNPAEIIGKFIRDYQTSLTGDYHTYYENIEKFYQDPAADKFRSAASYLGYLMEPADPEKNPLTPLLKKLYENLDDENVLNLFPGVYGSGPIYNFVSGLLGTKVSLTDATITPEKDTDDPQEIVVTGNSAVLDGVPLAFEIKFTAPQKSVISEWKMTYTGDWLTSELPWLMFDQPYVSLVVADSIIPAQGSVGGILRGLDLDLSIRLPIGDGGWQLEGHFAEPASVSKFFQMAGGVNLVQALPSPFNALSAIGVTDCQMNYNGTTSSIEYVSFVMSSSDKVQLMKGLSMDTLSFNVCIQNPGSVADRTTTWSVMGEFKIGTTDDAGVIVLSMDYPGPTLSGQLTSGVIKVTDLFNLFLPGTVFDPQGESPEVTEFEASFDGTTGNYSVSARLNFDWTFQIVSGAPSVTITEVGVEVESQDEELQGGINGGIIFNDKNKKPILSITLSASYSSTDGWVFMGKQDTDTSLSLIALANQFLPSSWQIASDNDYALKNLSFTFKETPKHYEIGGETDGYWTIPFIDLKVRADLKFGYGKYKTASGDQSDSVVLLQKNGKAVAVDKDKVGYYCTLNADIDWLGIKMKLFYDYNPDILKYGFTWGVLTGYITKQKVDGDPQDHWIGTLKFTESVTLGSMIEQVISWFTGYKFGLGSPWNLLNSIPLSALELVYDFTAKTVSFKLDVGEINLGFCKITKIGVNYQSGQAKSEDNGVFITIDGSFFWLVGDDNPPGQSPSQIKWDASKPEDTPAPSGQGNKYLDLRLLALGQHVTIPGFATSTSVQDAIKAMATTLPGTEPGTIPDIVFDPNSSWLVGMDFGVLKLQDDKSGKDSKAQSKALATQDDNDGGSGYFIDLQIVFNDPYLYALRIALSGAPARIFKGLDFQILYRKISDSIGVYQAQIALPDVMRKIQLGTVNITLPVFAIEVYTNGDFLIDLGFPKNADFSRSFTLQMLIYVPFPIPIMGSAGLYFGKKSSATSTEVPVIDNGTFNPVIVFGVGIQFGLGYDFNAGILAAGFSLTFVTIIEGVLAKFNPYQPQDTSTGQQADIAPAYYYSVKGVVGIQGKLYGYVDFKIIKAEVSVMLSVLADITITAYKPIILGLTASVSVSVSIKINLGFFSIKISFSFSMTIRQSYEIKVGGGKAPWNEVSGAKSQNALQRAAGRAAQPMPVVMATIKESFSDTPTWSNLMPATTKAPLKGYLGFGLSIAGDMAGALNQQQAVYSAMLFIDSVAQDAEVTTGLDTSFEVLSKQIFRWVIAAFHQGTISASDVDKQPVSQVELQVIYDYLNDPDNTDPMPVTAIDTFLGQQVNMTVSHPSDQQGETNAAYFPIAPKLSLSLPAFDQQPALNYSFAAYNTLSESYIEDLRAYFDALTVKMQEDAQAANALRAENKPTNNPESLGTFIYIDYFLMIARQMVQNAQDALSAFQYTMPGSQTVSDIVGWVNTHGQFNGYSYTTKNLFNDNKSHVLNTGKGIKVDVAIYATVSGDTFDSISKKSIYNSGFTSNTLATANADNTTILQNGISISYPGKDAIVVQAGNSLNSLAQGFGVSLNDLLSNTNVLQLEGLLMPSSKLTLPAFTGLTQDGDTLVSFSARYGVSIDMLADEPANAQITDLFSISDNKGKLVMCDLPQFSVGDLITEIQENEGLQQLSGMSSRYYLSGLRLPTNGITPAYQGMWINKQLQYQEATAGLFALTGQQFPLPVLKPDTSYDISFTIPSDLGWMVFDSGKPTMTISIAQKSDTYTQIDTVRSYAQQNYLDLAIEQLGMGDMFSSSYGHYSFSTASVWQAGSPLLLPYSGAVGDAQSLNIWTLPNDLINLADPTGRSVTPRFQVQIGTPDPVTQRIQSSPVSNYGWGTQVTFTVKRVPLSPDSEASATTYEISGADGNNALILEQMVTYLNNNDSLIDTLVFGFAPDQSNGSNPGIQTDPIGSLTIGIAQANLSTFTRPDSVMGAKAARGLQEGKEQSNLLNKPTALITLLWQASITRDGGYYLYYYNSENGEGLPDHAFNDKGEAALSLVVLYSAGATAAQQNLLQPYMNIFVTGDPVNSSESTIYAKADPIPQTATFNEGDTLSGIAFRYFTNIGDVVEANPGAPLTGGIDISVPEGVYQVRNAQGETLDAIAKTFGTSTDAIKQANPLVTSWPATLPLYTAVRLPLLTVKSGAANAQTLAAIAAFYCMDLTALANYNSNTANLFVKGTPLNMTGGPVTRVATVPAGVVSLEAIRTAPADVPPKPTDKDYAWLFLQQNFSILSFNLVDNSWFKASNPSLPAGPTDQQSDDSYSKPQDQSGKWVFKQSVPYYKFANELPGLKAVDGLPDASTSPYRGIGYLVQADFTWLDIYGNTILTTLSQPPSGSGIINEAPILTGYTDALLGVNQWPSVSSAWQVVPGTQKQIQIPLSFDTTPYNGLLSAKATNSTSLLLTFTEEVDPITAGTLSNYKLSPELNITAAAIQGDKKTIVLTTDAMSEDLQYTLAIGNIQNSGKTETFNGQATYSYPEVAAEATSSIVQQAQHDFQTYTQIWYQLTDPNGMAMNMQTSLFLDKNSIETVFPVDEAAYSGLVNNWIAPIYLYLQDRSVGQTSVAAPPATYTLSFNIDPSKVNPAQIFEVTLSLSLSRTGGAIMGDFETTGGIKSVNTPLSPTTDSTLSSTKALDNFADTFEQAMSIDKQYYLKVATGADREKLGQQAPDGTIWAVRLGIDNAGPIAYDVADENEPALFAPKPVSNKLESRTGVPIYNYTTGKGIDYNTPSNYLDFTEIDLDQWISTFFGAMDNILTPEFTASIQLVDKKLNTQYLKSIQDDKQSLAETAKLLMVPVFKGEAADPAAVQEALKQALLVKLTNLYATNSGIQFDVKVKADPAPDTPPNLYGNFLQNTLFEGAISKEATLTQVALFFSAPMDPVSAVNVSNYTLTAPLTVRSAALSTDGQSVVLTASENITLNITTVTIADTLLDANKRPVQGTKTDTIGTDYVSYAKPDQLTITSAKIRLDQSQDQSLAFLLTTPEIVRGQHGEVLSKIDLNLSYKGTDIEHQIATPINGYTPSSWLSFVLPDSRVPLESQLGGFSVPMMLRSFPVNPSLINQSSVAPYVNDPDISKLLQWEYTFDYSQTFHYPQDTLYCTINFNVSNKGMSRLAEFPDAFAQLAEFIMVYPSIDTDLKNIVTKVDAAAYYETGPDAETLFKNSGIALGSFVQVVDNIVSASATGNGLTMTSPNGRGLGSNNVLPYAFEIQEGPRGLDGQQVQVVSVYGVPPDGVGTPQVLISPDTYEMTPWVSTEDPCNGFICYYYINKTTGQPLLSDEAQSIQGRRVVLPGLNILQRQDAMTSVYLTRNENLIQGKVTSPDFVYTTGELSFSNPYLPTITSYQPIEIANLPANLGSPTVRTLLAQLQVLMATLLQENTEPELWFQMTCNYDYQINTGLEPITLPVMMQTMIKVVLATGLDPMLQSWTTFITDWLSTNNPSPVSGKLKFDLVIFSSLTQQPYPLVRLTELGLSLIYIQPVS